MGLFDIIKDIKEENKQRIIDEGQKLIEEHNFYKAPGILFKIIFPEKEIILKQRSGLTKGIATITLGLPGYALTSGTKEESQKKSIECFVELVDAGVIFKKAAQNGGDIRIPFENILDFNEVIYHNGARAGHFKMLLTGNQELDWYFKDFYNQKPEKFGDARYLLYEHIEKTIKEQATGNQNPEEVKWLSNSQKQSLNINKSENKETNNDLMKELEKLTVMYEKGLLTDEEFSQFKKKLIEDY